MTYKYFKKLIVWEERIANLYFLRSIIIMNCSPFVKVLETKLNIHGGARFGKIKSAGQKKCR